MKTENIENKPIENHPFEPFIPENAKILIMGTFPPPQKRWSMQFYYPNRTNDFWPIMGLIFYGDKKALLSADGKTFDVFAIKKLLTEKGIAMSDTGSKIRRLQDNASDKFLDIIEPVDLDTLLEKMPKCKTIATTGEKAANVIADLTDTEAPSLGHSVKSDNGLTIWRMPSTSRAYPLAPEKKAEYYSKMFIDAGIIS